MTADETAVFALSKRTSTLCSPLTERAGIAVSVCTSTCPPAFPARLLARTPTRRASLSAHQHRAGQSPFRQHSRPGGRPSRTLRALQACPDLVRTTTFFHWWPPLIKKREGTPPTIVLLLANWTSQYCAHIDNGNSVRSDVDSKVNTWAKDVATQAGRLLVCPNSQASNNAPIL